MTNPPGRQTLQILLLLLGCMSVDKPWHTCMFGHSLADNFLESDGMLTAPVENRKSIFGHIKSRESCGYTVNDWERRPHSVSITEFGAVGDGKTLNTHAFENAMFYLRTYADKGGVQLYIPEGQWLTGSIKLISHLTLFLESGATILGSQDLMDYPIVPALPSYGRGRELPGPRHSSLINGEGLVDVIITGDNGTIDGQGEVWWSAFRSKTLQYTRAHLIELIDSENILISNLTFQNSPFWTIHPVYCKNVVVKYMTILAPLNSPNTDGIDPGACSNQRDGEQAGSDFVLTIPDQLDVFLCDSSQHVCIEDCYISVGDDAISIKSGWDQYGTSYGMPSSHIKVRRIVAVSQTSAGISFGSEMSGGISHVQVDDMVIFSARWGVRWKTAVGRGGYMRNISVNNVVMHSVRTAIAFMGNYGDHPDEQWNRTDYPIIENISIQNIVGENITQAGLLLGLPEAPFHNIRLVNIALEVATENKNWNCSSVAGSYYFVLPQPCPELKKEELLR